MRGLGPDVVSVVRPTGLKLLAFFNCIQLYILLSPYLCFISFYNLICICIYYRSGYIDKLVIFHANQTYIRLDPHKKKRWGWYHKTSLSPPVKIFLHTVPRLLWILFCYLCCVFVMLSCLFIATLWSPAGRANLLPLLHVMFSCVFVIFPMWCPRCGAWLYRFLIFAFLLTLLIDLFTHFKHKKSTGVGAWVLKTLNSCYWSMDSTLKSV